VARARAGPDRL